MKTNFEIIIYGRAGLGAKTCAQLIADSGLIDGKVVQAFPEYGPERRGAPVRSFVRLSDKQIRVHEPITNPDLVIVIDDTLFTAIPDLSKFTCDYIINTNKKKADFKKYIKEEEKTNVIDGSSISMELLKLNNPNAVLIGAFVKLFGVIKYSSVETSITTEFEKKGKKDIIQPNLLCLKKGFDYFK
ncbi:MAG: 2-oxoacid:acceptor oxidoreductase family protein [archaeon]|jgi:pyruvate ferredoxin oxidoreductase gamma subunit